MNSHSIIREMALTNCSYPKSCQKHEVADVPDEQTHDVPKFNLFLISFFEPVHDRLAFVAQAHHRVCNNSQNDFLFHFISPKHPAVDIAAAHSPGCDVFKFDITVLRRDAQRILQNLCDFSRKGRVAGLGVGLSVGR